LLTLVLQYTSGSTAIVFEQSFPDGVSGTSVGPTATSSNLVTSSFPSFTVEANSTPRGFYAYNGVMSGWQAASGLVFLPQRVSFRFLPGPWNEFSLVPSGVAGSGPLIVFSQDLNESVVISSFNNFMAHNAMYELSSATLSYGVMGSVTSIPAGYVLETVICAGTGVNSVMLDWGDMLLAKYNKERDAYKRDFTLRYLGYRYVPLIRRRP
jgi:hypothetical protein